MMYVLDTSAILSGKPMPPAHECVMPLSVVDEIRHGRMKNALDFILEAGAKALNPGAKELAKVREAAGKTGDSMRISGPDADALALALEIGATLLTDDYSMQNLATVLGIDYKALSQDGIKEVWTWQHRCKGCGRYFDKPQKDCPVCGSEVRTARKKG
jgi:UPF0271 protein